MKVLFRVDASTKTGTGHVSRCLTLAQEFLRRGDEVCLQGDFGKIKWLENRIEKMCIQVMNSKYSQIDFDAINKFKPDLLVLDSYDFDPLETKMLYESYYTMCMVDDSITDYWAHIYLNQNLNQKSSLQKSPLRADATYLTGEKFALIRQDILRIRKTYKLELNAINKIVVLLGGSEFKSDYNFSDLFRAVPEEIEINFIGGKNKLQEDIFEELMARRNVHFLDFTQDLSAILQKSDVAISAAGSTVLELYCIGIPSGFIPLAPNQVNIVSEINSLGIGVVLSNNLSQNFSSQNTQQIEKLIYDKRFRTEFSLKSRALVDGLGAKRVISEVNLSLGKH